MPSEESPSEMPSSGTSQPTVQQRPIGKSYKTLAVLVVVLVLVAITGFMVIQTNNTSDTTAGQATEATKVLLQTTMGDITLELYQDMPITTDNFAKLVKQGFYDGTIFHRVIEGFMLQGGDPTGTGSGGPGYDIKDEFTDHNRNTRGTISMANSGPNTGGSQFFINLADNNFLDTKHPVFGKVSAGMDVVDRIGKASTDANDRPLSEIKIIKASIVE